MSGTGGAPTTRPDPPDPHHGPGGPADRGRPVDRAGPDAAARPGDDPHGPATTAVLDVRDVHRTHGSGDAAVHALRGVSLTVAPGELVAVMGPSGSGKSTLLALAGGLDGPTAGEIRVEGQALGALDPRALARLRRRRIGYIFQNLNLLGSLTAAENVALPLELDGVGVRQGRRAARAALAEVGLAELGDRFPDQLSGGQQQRVAIARALVGERRLVLADEPTGALDSQTGEAVLRLLRRRVDAGAAAVLVTHEARHAGWADRVVFLRDGVMVDSTAPLGSVEQLLAGSGR
ncbi:ABC transporter ATP-binding protein [Micromonospora haikouensis]|uniref:ABC transporter ATP-binding protein n=1 Tax=Micromonospora haikouensis TaxID=686309 RepID=UPI0037B84EC7